KPGVAFTLGAMGSRDHNFYNEAYQRAGYKDLALRVQSTWIEGRREDAAKLIPNELVLQTNLLGTDQMVKQRIRAYRDAGITSVRVYFAVPGRQQSDQILAERGVFGAIDSVWIDLSLFDNGFTDGTFLGAGPFVPFDSNPGAQFFVWQHLLRARPHFYRLNAYVGTDWIELGRGMFETPDCVVLESMSCPPDELANEVNVRFVMTRDLPPAGSGAVL